MRLEAEKARLSEDAKLLPAARKEVTLLKREKEKLELDVAGLWKDISDTVAAKDMAMRKAEKADEILDCLRQELEAERESVVVLWDQLKEVEAQASTMVGLYRDALSQFGGNTSAPPGCGDVSVSLA